MASFPATSAVLTFLLAAAIFSTASATCAGGKSFSNNRTFAACTDLPALSGVLYWTYDQRNSSLSIAFSASPAAPAGWVSWGINPNKPAMIGTQAIIAYKLPNASVAAVTFNISEFAIKPSPIDYPVSGLAAESDTGGRLVLFATFALPRGTTSVNQVWQVGPGVTGGIPAKHGFDTDNLSSVGVLNLVTSGGADSPSTSPSPSTTPSPSSGSDPSPSPPSSDSGPSPATNASSTVGGLSLWTAAVVGAVALLLLQRMH